MATKQDYLGKWKHQNVYTYYDGNNKHWVMVVKHSYFGELIHAGLQRKPKLGQTKKYFKDRLAELNRNEQLRVEQETKETYDYVRKLCG